MVSEKDHFIDGSRPVRVSKFWSRVHTWALVITVSLWLVSLADIFNVYRIVRAPPSVKDVSKCTIKALQSDLSFLDKASAITKKEFLSRRDRLAVALAETGIDGFVLAPGYTSQYYANISQGSWEGEEPSERPFLIVILPETAADGTVSAKTGFLAPHFEEGRARMLPIPSKEKDLDIVVWEEEWSPYETLRKSRFFENHPADSRPKLMIEEEMRDFIVRGLDAASFDTVGLNTAAELVRQRKSPTEIEIMRAVNTGTLAAVRALRRCLEPGLTEDDVKQVYSDAVRSIGFEPTFTVVLFDENAALPHGGIATGSKKLTENAMILTDVGAHYLGYSSDVTRSFMITKPSSKSEDDPLLTQKQEVWQVVYEAQTAAMLAMVSNATAAEVDIAARTVIEHAGYGYAFTHRLGHSIGIKGHESPYLSKWNKDTRLQQGMVFTDEPGIYLEQRFGVRLEDVFVVTEDGEPELLTGGRAKSMYEP